MTKATQKRANVRGRDWKPLCQGVEIFRYDDGAPVRDVLDGRRSLVVCGHYSYKTLVHVPCEGHGEENVARALDCIFPVKHFVGQPETIRFSIDQSGAETYTPDFGVRFKYGYVRIEYKRLGDLWPPAPDPKDEYAAFRWNEAEKTRAKLRRAREAYHRAGLRWILLTDVATAKIANTSVVNEIVANCGWPIAEDDLGRLRTELSQQGPLPLGKCEELIREGEFARGELLSRIPENTISIELRRRIDPDTTVHLSK